MATAGTPLSSWRTTTTTSLVTSSASSAFFKTSLQLCQLCIAGDYAETLKEETFTDAKKTNYLEAVKYVANLVWNGEIIFASIFIDIFISKIFIPQSTRPSRRTATLTSRAPWSTWTSSTPSCSASTPRAS